MELSKSEGLREYIQLVILLALCTGLVIFGVSHPITIYIAFVLLIGYILFEKDENKVICTFFYFMSYSVIFKTSADGSSLFTYAYIALIAILLIRFRYFEKDFFIVFSLYALYIIVGSTNDLISALKQLCIPLIIYFSVKSLDNELSLVFYYFGYLFGVISSSLIGIFKNSIPNLVNYVTDKTTRITSTYQYTRFSGLRGDPNYYSVNLLLCLGITVYFHVNKRIPNWFAVIIYLFIATLGALTGSKAFLLVMVLVMVFLLHSSFSKKRYLLSIFLILGILISLVLVSSGRISAFDLTFERLLDNRAGIDITSDRVNIWAEYFQEFRDHPIKLLIGNGFGQGYSFPRYPHNTLIDYLDILGIIGSVLFVIVITKCIKKSKKEFINRVPLLTILFMYMSLSMITYSDYPFQLALALSVLSDVNNVDYSNNNIGVKQ